MLKITGLIFIAFFKVQVLFASVELGMGLNSGFAGRLVPSLNHAYSSPSFAMSAFSSGVKNDYYYHSVYGLNLYYMRKAGDLFAGDVQFGFGLGTMFAERGFQDLGDTNTETHSDYLLGPSFRVNWSYFDSIFMNIDATYGLRDIGNHIGMNFQEIISFSVGARLF